MFTNAGVQEMIDKYGDRICGMSLNNGKYLLIGYEGVGSVQLSDISFDTIGGCDVMVINHTDISHGRHCKYQSFITTEFIEAINVMSEEDVNYRIDPMIVS